MSLFISIASYCDPILPFTMQRALATARWPERLHFGVVDQSPDAINPGLKQALAPARLSYLRIDPVYARGPCWARAIAMNFYDGEDWFLQIDSHMDFDEHWDEIFIARALALTPGRRGVVLSAYPNAFVFDGQGQPVHKPATRRVLAHVLKPGTQFDPAHPVLIFEAHPVDSDQPWPGFHLGAGCLFSRGAFARQFPYDPAFYFHGEEQALALRVYTHGWDIFHIPQLPVYHLYNDGASGAPQRPLHWDEAHDKQRAESWWQLEQRSRQRLAQLAAGEPLGVFGLGIERTVAGYAAFCGIDYGTRKIEPRAFRAIGLG